MADFPTGKNYNYNWQNSKLNGITYSGSGNSQFKNDAGYLTSTGTINSASYALTASYALNSKEGNINTSSLVTTSSFNSFTSSYYISSASFSASIASLTSATSSYVLNSQTSSMVVSSASFSSTASYVSNAQTASYVLQAVSASFSSTASYITASNIEGIVTSASYALTASNLLNPIFPYTGSAIVSGSLQITGGIHQTGTFYPDQIDFIYSSIIQNTGSYVATFSSSGLLTYDTYQNVALELKPYINTGSFTGSLLGTASWAENSNTASYYIETDPIFVAKSASLATTGSNLFIGIQSISGALQLNPTEDPGTGNVSASYLIVTSSGDNTEFNLHYRNNGALWETHWLEERTDTGLVWGGVLTFTGTTMSITPGAGLIVNHNASTSSHGDTIPTYIEFGPITASATYITSSQVTYLLIDTDGSLIQQTIPFTPQQFNEKLPLGYIFCLTTSSISSYADARTTTYGQDEQQTQFIRAFGPLKVSGYDITPQSGSLKISIASGRAYRHGGFYIQDPDNPSIYDSTSVPTGSLVRVYRDPAAVGGFKATLNGFVPFTDIDPTMWDDGSGTLQSVGASEWTIQRLFQGVVNNITYIYYGQNTYDSLNAAIQSITTEAFEESQTSIIALPFIGYVICKGNTTNLADTTENKIINSGLFRNTAGSSGGGGVATTNLNDLADVNITSPSTGQALVYNAGLWINSNPTSASYASTASYIQEAISASFALTASYVLEAISSSFATSASYSLTSSYVQNAQTASYVLNAVSSSYASTASYVQEAISASYGATSSYTPNALTTASVNLDTITFTKGDGSTFPIVVTVTGSNTTASFINQSTWTFNHNLGTQFVAIQTFNTNYEQIIPSNITLNGINQATITFPTAQSGYALATLGGNSISELNKVFIVRFQATGINAADNTSYYATPLTIATTNATVHKYTLPYGLTLVGAHVTAYNVTTNATNELSSLYIRLNNTTDYLITNQVLFGGTVPIMNTNAVTGLSQSYAAGDNIQMKWTTPLWTTNPTSCGILLDLYFYKT